MAEMLLRRRSTALHRPIECRNAILNSFMAHTLPLNHWALSRLHYVSRPVTQYVCAFRRRSGGVGAIELNERLLGCEPSDSGDRNNGYETNDELNQRTSSREMKSCA